MDQRVVAGVGNVYKSEACFLAGVDPWRPVGGLRPEEAAALGATAARLMAADVGGGRPDPHLPAAGRAALGAGAHLGLRAPRQALPALRSADPLARAGRREPHDLLVPRLPALSRGQRTRVAVSARCRSRSAASPLRRWRIA